MTTDPAACRCDCCEATPANDLLSVRAASVRAFGRTIGLPCPDGHAPANQPCWVVPSDAPGAGLGIGLGPGQDRPVMCGKRARYAAMLDEKR